MNKVYGAGFALILTFLPGISGIAFAEESGEKPQIKDEAHIFEGSSTLLVIGALLIAVGLAYFIGRRNRK